MIERAILAGWITRHLGANATSRRTSRLPSMRKLRATDKSIRRGRFLKLALVPWRAGAWLDKLVNWDFAVRQFAL